MTVNGTRGPRGRRVTKHVTEERGHAIDSVTTLLPLMEEKTVRETDLKKKAVTRKRAPVSENYQSNLKLDYQQL